MSEDDLIYQDFAFYFQEGHIVQEHHIQGYMIQSG